MERPEGGTALAHAGCSEAAHSPPLSRSLSPTLGPTRDHSARHCAVNLAGLLPLAPCHPLGTASIPIATGSIRHAVLSEYMSTIIGLVVVIGAVLGGLLQGV